MDKQVDIIINLGIMAYVVLNLLILLAVFGGAVTGIYLLLKNFG